MRIANFIKDESGAVTVDWVVLTAGVTGLGIAALLTVSSGIKDLSSDVSTQMTNQRIFTSFNHIAVAIGFADNIDGWMVTGTGRPNETAHNSGPGSDGQPGFMMFTDSTAGHTWLAMPDTFSGDHAGKYGGSLSYDLNLISGTNFAGNPPIMKLTGANGTVLQYSDATLPERNQWTNYSADLTAGNWVKRNGQAATEAELRAVLADIQSSEMRVEYINGGEQIGVDNVQFNAPG